MRELCIHSRQYSITKTRKRIPCIKRIIQVVVINDVVEVKVIGEGPLCRPRLGEFEPISNGLKPGDTHNHRRHDVEVMLRTENCAETLIGDAPVGMASRRHL
jgi:hypothetical protein